LNNATSFLDIPARRKHWFNSTFSTETYIDELERALYNAALGGVALAGNRYYYQNPLQGEGLRRWEWHGCPCCPPMFLKLMGALTGIVPPVTKNAVVDETLV
jgi:DUF1680 family protein